MPRLKTGLEMMFAAIAENQPEYRGLSLHAQMKRHLEVCRLDLAYIKRQMGIPTLDPPYFFRLESNSRNTVNLHAFLQSHLTGRRGGQIFAVAERFARQLDKTRINLACDLLPVEVGYSAAIELPYAFKAPDDVYQRTAILTVLGGKGEADDPWDRTLVVCFPDLDKSGHYLKVETLATIRLIRGRSLEEMIDECDDRRWGEDGERWVVSNRAALNLVAKSLLYIHSENPDIKPMPANPCLSKKEKKVRRHLREFCPLPVVTVGFSFHGRVQHIEETSVQGYFRWQPWGAGRARVKLIWIDEHLRRYHDGEHGAPLAIAQQRAEAVSVPV